MTDCGEIRGRFKVDISCCPSCHDEIVRGWEDVPMYTKIRFPNKAIRIVSHCCAFIDFLKNHEV